MAALYTHITFKVTEKREDWKMYKIGYNNILASDSLKEIIASIVYKNIFESFSLCLVLTGSAI